MLNRNPSIVHHGRIERRLMQYNLFITVLPPDQREFLDIEAHPVLFSGGLKRAR
jgi:hypothetical protein